MTKKPNIIFLLSDQHRHGVLGCAGDRQIQTPNLDNMASQGVHFSRMYCQGPLCQPSRASLITGLYPHQHGIKRNHRDDFNPAWPTLMKHLKEQGYRTAVFGKTHYNTPQWMASGKDGEDEACFNFKENESYIRKFGFDRVMEESDRYHHGFRFGETPYTEYLKELGLFDPYRKLLRSIWRKTPHHFDPKVNVVPQEHEQSPFIANHAINWLKEQDPDLPFFMTVGFVQPHVPMMADPTWADFYKDMTFTPGPRRRPEASAAVWGRMLSFLETRSHPHRLTHEYLSAMARQYYGMISLIDQCIGDIVHAVEASGQIDNTWFVYSADHGELLGDHHLLAKHCFYENSVRVPTIIKPPAGMDSKVVHDLTESIDLTATMLDLAGANPLPGSQARSLMPYIKGEEPTPRRAAFSEIQLQGKKPDDPFYIAVFTGEYRLTFESESRTPCELFNLKEDPEENHNRVHNPGDRQRIGYMVEELIKPHLEDTGWVHPD